MSAITVGGDLVHYEVLGQGRPVVLVHGWLGSWRYWIPTMQQLHMKYRVYALDLFGFGDSSKNPAKFSLSEQVDMLEAFMDELGLKRAAFIGHGLGAMVLAEYAFKHQKTRVPRLMLMSTPLYDIGNLETRVPMPLSRGMSKAPSGVDPDLTIPASSLEATIPSANMMRAALIERAAALNIERGKRASLKPNEETNSVNYLADSLRPPQLSALLDRCFKRNESAYEKLYGDVALTDERILPKTITEFNAAKMLDTVYQLQMPTALVHGLDDPLIPPPSEAVWDYLTRNKEENMIAIPLPNVRHFPMLEHERFGSFLREFLESNDMSTLEVKERWRRRSR